MVVPFSVDQEKEQWLRCEALAARGLIHLMNPNALTPSGLAAAIDKVRVGPRPPALDASVFDGVARSIEVLTSLLASRQTTERVPAP